MLQNLTKGKMVEWVVLLVALVALGLSIAAVAKPCKSDFGDVCKTVIGGAGAHDSCEQYNVAGKNCNPNGQGCLSDGTGCKDCAFSPNCKCGDGSGPPPSYDKLCPSAPYATTKQDCPHPCVWSSANGKCLTNKLPSGKTPPLHRDECEDYMDPCERKKGEHPHFECCKNENLHCKQTNEGPTGLRCLHPDKGKKRLIGGAGLSRLDNIGGGPGLPSPSPSHSPSPSPSPSPGGGKKSSDLPLILGLSGGGLVIVLAIAYLIVTKRLKL